MGRGQFPAGTGDSFRLITRSAERRQEENAQSSQGGRRRSDVCVDPPDEIAESASRPADPEKFSKLISREGEDTFVERLDKQARMQQLQRSGSSSTGLNK